MNKLSILLKHIIYRFFMLFRPVFWDKAFSVPITTVISFGFRFEKNGKYRFSIGEKSRIIGNGKIRTSNGIIEIGKHCEIRDSNIQANKGKIVIGHDTFLNSGCTIVSCEGIKIGARCAFGTNVSIYDHDHVFVAVGEQDWNSTKTSQIEIGDNCWLGCNVVILRGSKIGNNCVIGAGTVIKDDIPDSSLVYQNRINIVKKIE